MPKLEESCVSYLGIDPGASGGIACVSSISSAFHEAHSMPLTERDIFDLISSYRDRMGVRAMIEKVQGYIGSGQPGSAMFKFGASMGGLRMALVAAGISFEEVTPQVWQKALGISPRKKTESKTAWKNRLRAKAQQLFPHVSVTLATADALLIAEFCRRLHTGVIVGKSHHEEESE